jgi:hypothetical protein
MALREQYQKLIDKKRSEVEELRTQLTAAEAYIAAMQDAIKLLPRDMNGDSSASATQLREGSKLAKVRDLLRTFGKPLPIGEILTKIGDEVTTANRTGLSGSLGGYARQGKIFTKTGPNEFGLLEFVNVEETESDEFEEQEPEVAKVPEARTVSSDDISQQAEISDDDIPF